MKKSITFVMGLVMAVSAMAQYLVYDYTVSFKRADAQFTKISYQYGVFDGNKKDYVGYFDSYKTATDKLVGYVIVPSCKDCNGTWEEFGSANYTVADADASSAFVVEETTTDAYVVVTRNGDDLTKNPYLSQAGYSDVTGKLVWVLQAHIDSAMFGKGAAVRLPASTGSECSDPVKEVEGFEGAVTSLKAAKEAWVVLTYDVPSLKDDEGEAVMVYPPVKGMKIAPDGATCPTEKIIYGFLGYLSLNGNISNAGFGTVTTTTTKGTTTVGFCGTKITSGVSCIALNSLSGSTIGYFAYTGLCTSPAFFDICTKKAGSDYAPIAGTFTFKLNASLSKKYGADIDSIKNYLENIKFNNDTFVNTGVELGTTSSSDDTPTTEP